jgi:aryl-alcohol dehydrogenase-like predicted oxidoreductase
MLKRQLGKSGIEVSAIGLGCMAIGGPMMARKRGHQFYLGQVDDDRSIQAIHRAMDLGVNFFDTAAAYGAGHSERLLGRAVAGRRDKVVIATKFGKPVDEEDKWYGRYANNDEVLRHIRQECEASLRRLNTDYVDLYQFHLGDYPLDQAVEARDTLEELVVEGKIRFYGWSTHDPERARLFAQGEHCVAIQHCLNVVSDAPEILAVCDEFKQASIANGPLASGFLTGKYTADNIASLLSESDFRNRHQKRYLAVVERLDAIREILTTNGRTLAQGALAWIWTRSDRTIPIPGFRTLTQVEQNVQALDFDPLTSEQMAQIDTLLERNPG